MQSNLGGSSQQFRIDNLAYRIGMYHPGSDVQIGSGCPGANIVVVQPHRKFPERDAITGALKRFGMLDDAFRTTIEIASEVSQQKNREYLVELIELIRPLVVVCCGQDVTSLLLKRSIRSFGRYSGKIIRVEDLTTTKVCATLNPMDYGFSRASEKLKKQGKSEWESISRLYTQERKRQEDLRWAV